MRRKVWLGFGLFCFLAGSRWLLEQAVPAPVTSLVREAMHHGLLVLIFAAWAVQRREGWAGKSLMDWLEIAGAAALVFVLPDLLINGAAGAVTSLSETLVFLLVPVVVVFVVAQQASGFGVDDGARGLLGPALAGLAGAGLMIPFTMPPSVAGKVWLGALVAGAVLAGIATVRVHALLRGTGIMAATAVVSGVIAVLSGVAASSDWRGLAQMDGRGLLVEAAIAVFVDGPLLVLAVWLLREMPPVGFVVRYFLVLLITIVESFIVLHPSVSWYTALGAVLMAAAVWLLLRGAAGLASKADSEGSPVKLRGAD
ncbi:hypothetical protein [Granulicella tundricola]|uniref:EamA domain-containing protein n=1 Tax=Granulicella tundricola (strain ATCC BAA-1859 / DSM 23138 / MP5ACTX9) TaxID=1198114 RepID=E8X3U2_GRATM|nr:hypothetical protein [Granulicella tundricola]ADW69370.1 hypothetical protein AciX9_2333 [Granulicella tundricola MP5ACTX9]